MRDISTVAGIGAAKGGAALLSLITSMVAANIFSPEMFGQVSLTWSIAVVGAVFIEFGAGPLLRKKGGTLVDHEAQFRSEITRFACGHLIRGLLLSAIAVAGLALDLGDLPLTVAVTLGPIALAFAIELLLAEFYRSRRQHLQAEFFSGGFRQVAYALSLLIVVLAGKGSALLALSLLPATMLIVGLVIVATLHGGKAPKPYVHSRLDLSRDWKERSRFLSTALLLMLGQQFPILAAGVMSDRETAAVVRVSLLFGILMQFGAAANAMYFAPHIALEAARNPSGIHHLARRSARLGGFFIPVGIAAAAAAPFYIPFLFGSAYGASVPGAQILILTYSTSCLFGAFGQMLLLTGHDRINLGGAVILLGCQAALCPVLLPAFGPNAYSLAFAVGTICSLAFLGGVGYRRTGVRPGPF